MLALLIEAYTFHFYWFGYALEQSGDDLSKLLFGVVFPLVGAAIVFFPLSRRLRGNARRRALVSADEARLTDPRRPVLFLRSFRDDQVSLADAKIPWFLRFFDPGAISGTLEGLIVQEYSYLGPVVAIGNPSDKLPALGAVRKYCHGDEWHEVVQSLMDEAVPPALAPEDPVQMETGWVWGAAGEERDRCSALGAARQPSWNGTSVGLKVTADFAVAPAANSSMSAVRAR